LKKKGSSSASLNKSEPYVKALAQRPRVNLLKGNSSARTPKQGLTPASLNKLDTKARNNLIKRLYLGV